VSSYAVSDNFSINLLVGNDSTSPSVPSIQSATPVTATQVNVVWSVSTDNVQVQGYRLFRNGVVIATTTQTNFSDTDLNPETIYTYTVDAYDIYGNFSSSSVAVGVNTPALPVVIASTTTSNTRDSSTAVSTVRNMVVTPIKTGAQISWQTSRPSSYVISWGRTTSYELGVLSTNTFNQNQSTSIDDLEPGTKYWYKIISIDSNGKEKIIKEDNFTTLSDISAIGTVGNVQYFTARADNTDVYLRWSHNQIDQTPIVRVVRSHLFYPLTIDNGAVIYEGRAMSFVDAGALQNRSPQYYTIFVLGEGGHTSSGAVSMAYTENQSSISANGSPTSSIVTNIGATSTEVGAGEILHAEDIFITQDDTESVNNSNIKLTTGVPFFISIPRVSVSKNLKSIIVSVEDTTDNKIITSYLLKLNGDGDKYIAQIPGATASGRAHVMIEVFDYNQQTVRRVTSVISFEKESYEEVYFPDGLYRDFRTRLPLLATGSFVTGSLWWWILFKKRRRAEDKL
jgi:hypothetical protein